MTPSLLRHRLLDACGVEHGFGVRGADGPNSVVRPRQVHGANTVTFEECAREGAPEADAVVSAAPDVPIGVVTADCVPILLSTVGGTAVAAIHAGWRGLGRGVAAAGAAALRRLAGPELDLYAVVGPHIGRCCYEVDRPVLDELEARFAQRLSQALASGRPGHWMLDLAALVRMELATVGIEGPAFEVLPNACTCCDRKRFHSYRRDGPSSGRLYHYIAARPQKAGSQTQLQG